MKQNAYSIVVFFAFLCMSGQSPRKEIHEITTKVPEKAEVTVEIVRIEKDSLGKRAEEDSGKTSQAPKSAAQRAREGNGTTVEAPISAAKRAIQAEIARFLDN